MKSRIAIWTALGVLVVVGWRVYIAATLSNPLHTGGMARALIYLTCPIAMAHREVQGFYVVLLANAATYALAGAVIDAAIRRFHLRLNPI